MFFPLTRKETNLGEASRSRQAVTTSPFTSGVSNKFCGWGDVGGEIWGSNVSVINYVIG